MLDFPPKYETRSGIFDIAKKLWRANKPDYKNSNRNRKHAAMALFFTTYGGMRWGDCFKMRWENVRLIIRPHGKFISFRLRGTKSLWDGSQNQFCTIPIIKNKKIFQCPVRTFIQYWKYFGKPRYGFIFGKTDIYITTVKLLKMRLKIF